jgi:type IV pilus assembly protein PilE
MQVHTTSRHAGGFTLVELLVTIVIATILVSIAIPSYTSQMRKSKRTDAKTALLDLAGREERYMATNSAYTADPALLGYGAAWPVTLPNGDYQIIVPKITDANAAVSPPIQPSYVLTANAYGAAQTKDTTCATFTLDSKGVQSATSPDCW